VRPYDVPVPRLPCRSVVRELKKAAATRTPKTVCEMVTGWTLFLAKPRPFQEPPNRIIGEQTFARKGRPGRLGATATTQLSACWHVAQAESWNNDGVGNHLTPLQRFKHGFDLVPAA
jgi:hypothetical protein